MNYDAKFLARPVGPRGISDRYRVFTRSSKRPALRLLEVCWTFAGSC